MFRQLWTVALVRLLALGSLTLTIAISGCSNQPSSSKPDAKTQETGTGGKTTFTKQETGVGSKADGPPKGLTVDLGHDVKLEMVLIPAGEFMMGSPDSDKNADDNEKPQHRVRIMGPFYLGKYHVTRGQFRQFVAITGYKTVVERGNTKGELGWNPDKHAFELNISWRNAGFEQTDEHPVVNVSWNDAVAFCKWLSRKEGKAYRLPTEAEWEYACRAGTTTQYYSGDDPETLAKVGNVADATLKAKFPDSYFKERESIKASDGYAFTAPVGSFQPNAFGLYDMHGNVWQWCSDWYSQEYYGASPVNDPTGPDSGDFLVLRGGTWCDRPECARSAMRHRFPPSEPEPVPSAINRSGDIGFRVAMSP